MKTEAETLVEIEKLIESLEPDAKKRAGEYLASRYGAKAAVALPFGPTVNPPTFIPVPYPVPPAVPHPDLGPPWHEWPGAITVSGTTIVADEWRPSMLAAVAARMTDAERFRFTACAPSLPPEFVGNGSAIFFGPGAALPSGPPMRSWS